jgi:transcriptional regulator with XRE-family HTH domain
MARATKFRVAREKRQAEVARLYTEGWTQAEIAGRLGVTQQTVSGTLKAVRQQWRERAIADVGLLTLEELHKIRSVEREAWSAWRKSLEPGEATTTERASAEVSGLEGSAAPEKVRVTMRREDRAGEPRYLQPT